MSITIPDHERAAAAAISEGHCPAHGDKLDRRIDWLSMTSGPAEMAPLASGWCRQCRCVWSTWPDGTMGWTRLPAYYLGGH